MFPNYIDDVIKLLFYVAIVTVPLALWKLIDIAIWCFEHIKVAYE